MCLIGIDTLLSDYVLVTYEKIETVVFALKQLLEVVVDSIRTAETMTVGVDKTDSRHVLVFTCWYVLYIICSKTEELLVILVVVVITELSLETEVVDDFPSERSCHVKGLLLALHIIVTLSLNRVVKVTEVIISSTCRSIEVGERNRSIDNRVLQTAVGIVCTCSILSTTTIYVCIRVASLEIQSCALCRLGIQFEAEVVALVA